MTFLVLLFSALATLTNCKKTVDVREDFVANYNLTETWTENGKTLSKPIYSMPIYKSTINDNLLLLNNFGNYGLGITAEATVNGNSITIPQQTLPNLITINGSGTLNGTTLTFTYTETFNGIATTVSTIAKMR
jgi:hypothetical protein